MRVVVREKERQPRVRALSAICKGVEEIRIGIRIEGDLLSASLRINAFKNPA